MMNEITGPELSVFVRSLSPWLPLMVAILSLSGVVYTSYRTGELQRRSDDRRFDLDRRQRLDEIAQSRSVARLTLRAELSRIHKIILGQYGYLEERTFIWIPLYETSLPSAENIERVGLLTDSEIKAVTSFFFSYQEHMSYIVANGGSNAGKNTGVDMVIIGYDLSEGRESNGAKREPRAWLLESLGVIERKALRALEALEAQIGNFPVRPPS